jgi:hypothetical protein
MKSFTLSATAAAVLSAAAMGLASTATAAPTGPQSAAKTVSALQAAGFQVIVNKIGSAPLERCTVDAVRPGQTYTRMDSGAPGAGMDIVTTVTGKTVYVDVQC